MGLMGKRQWSDSDSEWVCLPGDLIDSILDKLFVISDYVRFGAVCKSWNSLCKKHYKEKRSLQSTHQLPWLPVEKTSNTHASTHPRKFNLYNITTGEMSKFQFCEPNNIIQHDGTCYGSSHGWLFYMSKYSLLVFNPLSGTVIRLPEFKHPFMKTDEPIGGRYVLSRNPSLGPFEVLATCYLYKAVAHLNSTDNSWTYSETKNDFDFYKLIFYKGHKLGVHAYGQIMFLDVISGECINVKQIASSPPVENLGDSMEPYFVENTSGDLLLVHRYFYECDMSPDLMTYKIYKLMIIQEEHEVEYVPIVNLGGDSFFLGTIHCVSVLAANYPPCLPNTIYCADAKGWFEETVEVCNFNGDIESSINVSSTHLPHGYFKIPLRTWLVMLPKF